MDNFVKPHIEGVTVVKLSQLIDERGAVLHVIRSDEKDFSQFGECYFSELKPGAVKAWKRHKVQTQQLAVPVGRVQMVIFDNREGSRTRGQLKLLELGRPDAYARVRVPPGLWYGFECISDVSALVVNCADMPHNSQESEQLPSETTHIPYKWSNIMKFDKH